MKSAPARVICIGAGPAGLTAAYHLGKAGAAVTVFERDPRHVGGISRTETYKSFRFDVGGHRFFSKSQQIEDLWDEILGDKLLTRRRKSRIFYNGKLFDYPLKALDVIAKLGPLESVAFMLSYARARVFPVRNPRTFEDWVTNHFGHRLFDIFFKSYTEKVWGMKCKEISADWAAQRIKGLSLGSAVMNALLPRRFHGANGAKTLTETFRYPPLGPGQMWEAAAKKITAAGNEVILGMEVKSLVHDAEAAKWRVAVQDREGSLREYEADHVISSAPISELAAYLGDCLPDFVSTAARSLRYRDFLTVVLITKNTDCFDDNWIYIHDASVKVGRIQNFRSWSPHMVPDPELNCLGLEYFCFEGDGLWESGDEELIRLADEELIKLGLLEPGHVVDGTVLRQPKAYPVYDENYEEKVDLIRHWLQKNKPGLHLVGRNGMHKYNNQDHSMMTALLTAENILSGETRWNVWGVNQDAEYIESGSDPDLALGERMVPRPVARSG
jgi:protoporphyrinogen oxidase